ncbi:putative ubiquitin carboxyl-terminal hydrolase 12 [Wickerhamomyces ciferrii]|uniref:ubiquitinyl hydrolase 1 n=1 Tax=Wickerhamomyces ciferrii (strain ATCC 14091 / BCRC 22168 / CBS 111 / JCM 3599 / NBRC 0793 / NRRL Y-1031 F-60-10) TaxID=1206466 RepID=K0KJP2_WICCF|nr:putative ubiquitin carboxyl-terminal hydrolase 12 [Wickerhamomyces ciferrii]CCH42352.1 putative ubiquitin carboxyl-terminal hydrolase 12 [Wickerhamomyces ciferrii]
MTLEKSSLNSENYGHIEQEQHFEGAAVGEIQDYKLEDIMTPKESEVNPFDVEHGAASATNSNNNNHEGLNLDDDVDNDHNDGAVEVQDQQEKVDDDVNGVNSQLPSIEEQRSIITGLLQKQSDLTEGSELRAINETWFEAFQNNEFKDQQDALKQLSPINTSHIIDKNGIFADPQSYPYIAISVEIFDTLVSWYSLAEGSKPVVTYAIEVGNQLMPEFSKPYFQLHHLVVDTQTNSTGHSFSLNLSHTPIPSFTLSVLNSCYDLVQKCIELLNQHVNPAYHQLSDPRDVKYKVWVVSGDNLKNYEIPLSKFENLAQRVLIKKEHHQTLLKSTQLRNAHLVIEKKITSPGTKSYWPSDFNIHFPATPSNGCIGLTNLGNSCYMNSALQCLVHIPELTQYFLFDCFENELNPDNPLGFNGDIAKSFGRLIHLLFDKKSFRNSAIAPRDFKNIIGRYNSMFHGYLQQDSQEFFAYLLDGLHEDLNRIINKPATEKPELNSKNATIEEVQTLAEQSWVQHKLRNDSVIIDLFVGLYKSTLVCPDCSKVSITFDPFSDLTLPLPTETFWSFKILLFLDKGPMKSFEVELPKGASYNKLKQYVAEKLSLNVNYLAAMDIFNGQFYMNFEDPVSKSGYLPVSELFSENDCIIFYEIPHEKDDLIVPVVNTKTASNSNIPSCFAYPFFITLKPEETKSFGTIRRKLEERYEQLSSYKYFTKVRENQNNKSFTIHDFPLLSQSSGSAASEQSNNEDEGYQSDVSLANPEISGDYAFKVKVHDASKVKIRQRRTIHSLGNNSSLTTSENQDVIYAPNLNNDFTNLPDLLDFVPEPKRSYYTYGHKLDIDNSTNSDISIDTPISSSNGTKVDSSSSNLGFIEANIPEASKNGEINQISSNDDEETTPEVDMALDIASGNNDDNSEPGLSPLFDTKNSSEEDGNLVPISETLGSVQAVTESSASTRSSSDESLIKHGRTALVCEWTSDSYDTFFSGLDDECEGGTNLWENLEAISNEEVEVAKKRRIDTKNESISLDSCLKTFSKPEVLGEEDLWYCSDCKEHRQASKQISIWSTPDILTIHLKRFTSQRSFSDKISKVVNFPIEGFDVSPYISSPVNSNEETIYDLFAVDNHWGGISGGHYTSKVKNFVDNQWYNYNDSHVSPTSVEDLISAEAYLLFYRRRSSNNLGSAQLSEAIEKGREEYEEYERDELRLRQEFYEDNRDSSSDEDEDEEEHEQEHEQEQDLEDVTSSEEEEVSSIHVGSDIEDDESATRRKQRVLGRGKRSLLNDNYVQSDIDTSAIGSPNSVISDDPMSEYSTSLNVPTSVIGSSVNSPRPGT